MSKNINLIPQVVRLAVFSFKCYHFSAGLKGTTNKRKSIEKDVKEVR